MDLGGGQLPDLREDVLFETMEDIAGGLGYHSSRDFDLAERVGFAHVPQAAAALANTGLRIPHE